MKLITVGRSNKNNIVVSDIKVSDEHAQIVVKDSGLCSIVDLNSANGTFVNDVRISGETPLKAGDRVRVGNTTLPWQNYIESGSQRKLAVAPSTPTPAPSGGAPQKNGAKRWVVIILAIIITALMIIGVMGYMWSSSNNTNATRIKGYKAQIDSLKTEMIVRDSNILDSDREYMVLEAKKEQLENEIAAKEKELADKVKYIKATDKEFEDRKIDIEALKNEKEKLKDTIEANKRELAAKVNLIKAKDAEIDKLKDTITVKNAKIGDLNGIITMKNVEIARLKDTIAAKDKELKESKSYKSRYNKEVQELNNTIKVKNAEINRLKDTINVIEKEIDELKNSLKDGQKQTKKDEAPVEQQSATQMTEGKEE